MKRWLSKDAIKLRLGIVILLAFMGFAAISITDPPQQSANAETSNIVTSAQSEQIALSEKPTIAVTETKVVTTEEEIPFVTTQTYDGMLPKDTNVVRVEGRTGKKIIKTEVKIKDGVEVGKSLISEEITVPPVAKVVAIGTKIMPAKKSPQISGECDLNYTPCIKKSARDLDCADIGFRVQVVTIGQDPHGFDRDQDGSGCETYPEQPTRDVSSD